MTLQEKIQSNKMMLFEVDWKYFCNVILEKLRILARKRQIELKIYIAEKEDGLPIKVKHLEYLIIELVDNAIKFSFPNSEVSLFIQNSRQYMLLRVKDYGIGMPFRILPQIFDKFYQYEQDPKKRQGAGLGLSIVKGITEIYHGHTKIVTEPGTGTEVEICFSKYHPDKQIQPNAILFQERHLD